MTAYRRDIDGLRAIAVVAVVLFHAHIGPFTGGFVGVDVFFVISGYLIVGIILDDIRGRQFSIAMFYERRVRRLFPALFVVLIACTIAGYLLFLPAEFAAFGRSVVATSAFASNFLFWHQAGYFDTPAELKPLLHTWSLAVEEQFYLVFPALLIVLSKYPNATKATWLGVLAIALISFALSAGLVGSHPDAAFYLPHTRIWELMIGALLVCAPIPAITTPRAREAAALLGLVLIGASVSLYSPRTPFPGIAALPPCVGAALIIHAGRSGTSRIHSLLSSRAFVYVGLISYSLYLWHWPILVFARAVTAQPLTSLETLPLVALSLVAADLSWRFIEAPFRGRGRRFSRAQIFAFGGAASIAMLLTGAIVDARHGLPARLPDAVVTAAAGSLDTDSKFKRRCMNFAPDQVSTDVLCRIGSGVEPTFLLWGDSHANALAPVISDVAESKRIAGLFAGSGGCAPLLGVSRTDDKSFPCEAFNARVMDLIRHDAKLGTVMLAARWALTADGTRYLNESGTDVFVRDAQSHETSIAENAAVFQRGLERTLTALRRTGRRIVVVGPIPEIGFDVPTSLARDIWFNRRDDIDRIEPSRAAFFKREKRVLSTLHDLQTRFGFVLIEPYQVLCDANRCNVGTPARPLYVDDNHLSITGARKLRRLFEAALDQSDIAYQAGGATKPPGSLSANSAK